jgi:hypothetical protein
MRRFQLLFLAIPLFTLSQCKKDDGGPQLPPETTTGANKAGCKIDGQVLIPRSRWTTEGLSFRLVNLGESNPSRFGFSIVDAQVRPSPYLLMEMDSVVLREGQTYQFKTTRGNPQVTYYSGNNSYIKRDQDDGEITITRLDKTKNIISGRFNFVGTETSTGQQVQVTEGRFDFSYQ